ncbi:hypothetical protein LY76DRAFT_672673 [Colletotrichum caudatum]|nr:hypothetical protein LY76DRAFT_672673 [Colletotrichum caudatum]
MPRDANDVCLAAEMVDFSIVLSHPAIREASLAAVAADRRAGRTRKVKRSAASSSASPASALSAVDSNPNGSEEKAKTQPSMRDIIEAYKIKGTRTLLSYHKVLSLPRALRTWYGLQREDQISINQSWDKILVYSPIIRRTNSMMVDGNDEPAPGPKSKKAATDTYRKLAHPA